MLCIFVLKKVHWEGLLSTVHFKQKCNYKHAKNAVHFGIQKIPPRRTFQYTRFKKIHLKIMQMQCALVLQKSPLRRTFRYTSYKTKMNFLKNPNAVHFGLKLHLKNMQKWSTFILKEVQYEGLFSTLHLKQKCIKKM